MCCCHKSPVDVAVFHVLHHDSAWQTFILKHIWSIYPVSFGSCLVLLVPRQRRQEQDCEHGSVTVEGAGDGGVQSDGYINGPAAVYCGNCEGYLCGPQQHDSTGQHWTRPANTETEQTHTLHGSGSQVPVLVRNSTHTDVIRWLYCLFKAHGDAKLIRLTLHA